MSKKKNHILLDAEFSAFAKYEPNDDVLFQVDEKQNKNQFVIVHLTYAKKKENVQSNFYPGTYFFLDFNDFAEMRMKPDHIEWNENRMSDHSTWKIS